MSIPKEIENIELDLKELTSLESNAIRENIKKLLSDEMKKLTQRKEYLEKQMNSLRNAFNEPETHGTQSLGQIRVSNYAWDQTQTFVKVYIEMEKGVTIDDSNVKLSFANDKSFEVIFGKYRFSICKLFAEISKDESYYKVPKSNKLIIYLKKKTDKNWSDINATVNSSETDKKGFDDKDIGDDPSASLMKMMKKMYDEGDDEMKRTISKSWFESQQKNRSSDLNE